MSASLKPFDSFFLPQKPAHSSTGFAALPPTVVEHIASNLELVDMLALACVDKHLRSVVGDVPHMGLRRPPGGLQRPTAPSVQSIDAITEHQRRAHDNMAHGVADHHEIDLSSCAETLIRSPSTLLLPLPGEGFIQLGAVTEAGIKVLRAPLVNAAELREENGVTRLLDAIPLCHDGSRQAICSVVSGSHDVPRVWRFENGQEPVVFEFENAIFGRGEIRQFRLGADGATASIASPQALSFWQLTDGKFIQTKRYPIPQDHLHSVDRAAMCPATGRVVSRYDNIITIRDPSTPVGPYLRVEPSHLINAVMRFSPCGRGLIISSSVDGSMEHSVGTIFVFLGPIDSQTQRQLKFSHKKASWQLERSGEWGARVVGRNEFNSLMHTQHHPLSSTTPNVIEIAQNEDVLLSYEKGSENLTSHEASGFDDRGNGYQLFLDLRVEAAWLYRLPADFGQITRIPFDYDLAANRMKGIMPGGKSVPHRINNLLWSNDGTAVQFLDVSTKKLHILDFGDKVREKISMRDHMKLGYDSIIEENKKSLKATAEKRQNMAAMTRSAYEGAEVSAFIACTGGALYVGKTLLRWAQPSLSHQGAWAQLLAGGTTFSLAYMALEIFTAGKEAVRIRKAAVTSTTSLEALTAGPLEQHNLD